MSHIKKIFSNRIFSYASCLIFAVIACAFALPSVFFNTLSWIQNIFVLNISWFYVLLVFFFFCMCLCLAFGPYGKIRLGLGAKPPRYSTFTWVAMLFSAGMGTGLLFSGVYEPLYHYFYPPVGEGGADPARELSYRLTFLHWGFSGWAIYTVMGLAIAYFSFRKGRPQRLSSIFYPLLKQKTAGSVGTAIDVLSVSAILFGVAVTLGRGSMQINSGLKELTGLPYSQLVQSGIICVVTVCAALSLLSGLNRGIRRLSELNIVLCLLLLLFTLFTGPTVFLFNSFVEHTGSYLQNLIGDMTRVGSLGSVEWRSRWTILYWAWWIAWAPFVGIFIARISEGRTIRQFVLACLIVPTVLSCLWFAVFGGTALHYHVTGTMDLKPFLQAEYSRVVFEFLKYLPFTKIMSVLTLFAVVIFFVTSSDSASYVVHHISSTGGKKAEVLDSSLEATHPLSEVTNPSLEATHPLSEATSSPSQDPAGRKEILSKIYWALLEGLLAMALICFGGIKSLELLVIVMAFPFSILMLLVCFVFLRELKKDFSLKSSDLLS